MILLTTGEFFSKRINTMSPIMKKSDTSECIHFTLTMHVLFIFQSEGEDTESSKLDVIDGNPVKRKDIEESGENIPPSDTEAQINLRNSPVVNIRNKDDSSRSKNVLGSGNNSRSASRGGTLKREVCGVCDEMLFLAQRIAIGGKFMHRTCFKCARCNAQLNPLSYYITENGQYCCEVCPDEEKWSKDSDKGTEGSEEQTRTSLAVTSTIKTSETESLCDDSSSMADTTLDNTSTSNMSTTGAANPYEKSDGSEAGESSSSEESESEVENTEKHQPSTLKPRTIFLHSSSKSNEPYHCSTEVLQDLGKQSDTEKNQKDSDNDSGTIVKESSNSLNRSEYIKKEGSDLVVDSEEKSMISQTSTVDMIPTDDINADNTEVCDKTNIMNKEEIVVDDFKIDDLPVKDTNEACEKSKEKVLNEPQEAAASTANIDETDAVDYPDDLNPFDDDSDDTTVPIEEKPKSDATEPDDNKEKEKEDRDSLSRSDAESEAKFGTLPSRLTASQNDEKEIVSSKSKTIQKKVVKVNLNPFGSDEEDDDVTELTPRSSKKLIGAPQYQNPVISGPLPSSTPHNQSSASLNPFWSDGEEPSEDEESTMKQPPKKAKVKPPRPPPPSISRERSVLQLLQ